MIMDFSAFCVRALTKIILSRVLRSDLERQHFLLLRENQILKRRFARRILFRPLDRHFLIAVGMYSRKLLNRISIVQPETVISWHRKLVLKYWHASNKIGRPHISDEVTQLIVEMKRANRRGGMQRIHGELKKLKITVSKRTIGRVLRAHGFSPLGNKGIGWFNFLRSHRSRIFASDFFEVPTLLLDQLHVFFVIDVKTREIIHWAVTKKPHAEWVTTCIHLLLGLRNPRIFFV
jgi:putative transposase